MARVFWFIRETSLEYCYKYIYNNYSIAIGVLLLFYN